MNELGQIQTPLSAPLLDPGELAADRQKFLEEMAILSGRAVAIGKISDGMELSLEPAAQNIVRHVGELRKLAYPVAAMVAKVATQAKPIITKEDTDAVARFGDELAKAEDAYAKFVPEPKRTIDAVMSVLTPIGIAGGVSFTLWKLLQMVKWIFGIGGGDEGSRKD